MNRKTIVLILQAIEMILCLLCFCFYANAIMDDEPLPHDLFSSGVYIGFFIYSAAGMMNVMLTDQLTILADAIITLLACLIFIFISIITMNYAENDQHLIYLTDDEESEHYFFKICCRQSLCALTTALFFAIHSLIMFDIYLNTNSK